MHNPSVFPVLLPITRHCEQRCQCCYQGRPEQYLGTTPLETAAQLRKYEKTVMEAVSDYLGQLYKHTMETLTRRYGETFMGMTKVQFVLTVPAVWSDARRLVFGKAEQSHTTAGAALTIPHVQLQNSSLAGMSHHGVEEPFIKSFTLAFGPGKVIVDRC